MSGPAPRTIPPRRPARLPRIAAVAAAACALGVPAAGAAAPAGAAVTVTVTAHHRVCTGSGSGYTEAPVAGARLLVLSRAGRTTARLSAEGTARIRVPGAGPHRAWVVLQDSRVRVAGPGRVRDGIPAAGETYRIALGALHPGANSVVLADSRSAGAATIWNVLRTASDWAEEASPVRPPFLTAVWIWNRDLGGPVHEWGGSAYVRSTRVIRIGRQDAFSAHVIAHEYGHHLAHALLGRAPGAGVPHSLTSDHPDTPGVPWWEGLADAVSAWALEAPRFTWVTDVGAGRVECARGVDFSKAPAVPVPEAPGYASANEGSVAGALWGTVEAERRGRPRPPVVRRLLAALHRGALARGGVIADVRAARDALTEAGWDATPAGYARVTRAFADQGIAYGVHVAVGLRSTERPLERVDTREAGSAAWNDVEVTLTSPTGQTCARPAFATDPPEVPLAGHPGTLGVLEGWVGAGRLPGIWQDDCLASNEPTVGAAWVGIRAPLAPAGRSDDGWWTVSASFACRNGDPPDGEDPTPYLCTPERRVELRISNGWGASIACGDEVFWCSSSLGGAPLREIVLDGGPATPLVRFTRDGRCEVLVADRPSCRV